MTAQTPDFVENFLAELYRAKIVPVRLSAEPLPGELHPLVISVVRNEIENIADFLRHYRCHGIRRFVILDNDSSDGTREFLEDQGDVDLYQVSDEFNGVRKQGWIAHIVMLYGYMRWYLIVDADEHVVFDGIEDRTFLDLTREMTRRGIRRVRGFLLDMYNNLPVTSAPARPGGKLRDIYPLFDKGPYREEPKPEMLSVKGGVRSRVFGGLDDRFDPELTKYPLLQLSPGEFPLHPHYAWPYGRQTGERRFLAILHYKFGAAFKIKIDDATRRGQYWNNSLEYRIYKKFVDENKIATLNGENSEQYRCSSHLVDLKLISPIDWGSRCPDRGLPSFWL